MVKKLVVESKKIGRPLQGVLMGEEKPDEELMGKRKSSTVVYDILLMPIK